MSWAQWQDQMACPIEYELSLTIRPNRPTTTLGIWAGPNEVQPLPLGVWAGPDDDRTKWSNHCPHGYELGLMMRPSGPITLPSRILFTVYSILFAWLHGVLTLWFYMVYLIRICVYIYIYIYMDIRTYGCIGTWCMDIRIYGYMGLWIHGNIAIWEDGYIGKWMSVHVDIWLCDYIAAWITEIAYSIQHIVYT